MHINMLPKVLNFIWWAALFGINSKRVSYNFSLLLASHRFEFIIQSTIVCVKNLAVFLMRRFICEFLEARLFNNLGEFLLVKMVCSFVI